jgi:hypothetical protein
MVLCIIREKTYASYTASIAAGPCVGELENITTDIIKIDLICSFTTSQKYICVAWEKG